MTHDTGVSLTDLKLSPNHTLTALASPPPNLHGWHNGDTSKKWAAWGSMLPVMADGKVAVSPPHSDIFGHGIGYGHI